MAANDEILGISAHMEASEVEKVINKIISDLNKVGTTAETSGRKVTSASKEVVSSGRDIETVFKNIAAAAGVAFGVQQLKAWATQVMMVRGEFQQLEVAFKTMLGSAEKANSLMNQLVKTAATTPFDLKGVAAGAKSLMAYGTAAEDVNDMLVRLGDIAAGMSIPLNDLVYLYGTTMVQGRMFTQDLRQFQGRGIPIAEELARVLGVAKDKIPELVTAGKITADVFDKAIHNMTNAGSKFGGLMDAQSKTITGQISNIEDSIDMMLNNIGKQSEGIINGALSTVSALVENYEKVGKAIVSLIAVYGTYKAAVMFVAAAEGIAAQATAGYTIAQQLQYKWLLLCEKAQKLLNATMLKNPYVLVATAIAAVVAALMNMKSAQDLVNDAEEEYNRKKDELIRKEKEHRQKIEELISVATDEKEATEVRVSAMHVLMNKYPGLFEKYNTEIDALKDIAYWKEKIAEIESGKSITKAANELEIVNRQIADLEKKASKKKTTTKQVYNHQTLQWETEEVTVPSLSRAEEAQLTQLKNQRKELTKKKHKDDVENYLSNLTGVSNADLEKQINERDILIAKATGNEKIKAGKVQMGGATGTFSIDEIKAQRERMRMELNQRKKIIEDSSKNFISATKSAYDKEKKILDKYHSLSDPSLRKNSKETVKIGTKDVEVSKLTQEQYEELIATQQEKVDAAKKKYESTSGKSLKQGDSEQKKIEAAAIKRKELLTKQEIEQARREQDLLFDTRQAGIDAEKDQSKKQIAQIELDHEQKMVAIERAFEDERLKRVEETKQLWESDYANQGKDFYKSDAYRQTNINTQTEKENREARIKAENKAYSDALKERKEMLEASLREYLKEYGTYVQKKQAIAEEYAKKLEKVDSNDTGEKLRLKAEERRKQAELDMQALQESIDWEVVFGNLDRLSTEALNELKEKLRKALNMKDITPENAKVLSEKLLEIDNRLSDNMWTSMIPALKERQRLVNEVKNAEEDIARAQQKVATSTIAQQKSQSSLQSLAKTLLGRNLTKEELASKSGSELAQALKLTGESAKQLADSFDKNKTTTFDLTKAQEELTASQRQAKFVNEQLVKLTGKGFGSQNFGSALTSIFSNAAEANGGGFMGYAKMVQQNANSLADFTDKIGLAGTDFGEAVHGFSDGVNGFMSAIQSLASGDVFGAVNGVIDGLAGFGKSLTAVFGINWSGGNAEEHDRKEEELIKANENLEVSINRLKESFDKANGMKAIEISQKIIDSQQKYNDNLMERWENDMYYHDAHHTNNYYWGGFSQNQIAAINSLMSREGYSDRVRGTDWTELTKMTPEALAAIRRELPEIWDFITSQGKYSWVYDSLNEYADMAGKIAEQEAALKENLTQLSESSLHNQFLSDLMDMKKETKDFGDDFTEILAEAVLNAKIGDLMDEDLKKWRENLATMMKKQGGLTKEDVTALREQWNSIVQSGLEARDTMAEITGYTGKKSSSQQSASANGIMNISYDQADSLVGIETAQQIVMEQSLQEQILQTGFQSSIAENMQRIQPAISDIKDNITIIAEAQTTMNNHLADISRFTSVLPDMQEDLYRLRKTVEEL